MSRFKITELIDDGWEIIDTSTNVKYWKETHGEAIEHILSWFEVTMNCYQIASDDMLKEIQRLRLLLDNKTNLGKD